MKKKVLEIEKKTKSQISISKVTKISDGQIVISFVSHTL